MTSLLFIEPSDFDSFPLGGQLTFSKQLAEMYPADLQICGLSRDKATLGRVGSVTFSTRDVPIFYFGFISTDTMKSKIPHRIKYLISCLRYIFKIRRINSEWVILQSHEFIFLAPFLKNKICFLLPGLSGPVSISRFKIPKYFSVFIDRVFFYMISVFTDKVIAAADLGSIAEFQKKYDFNKSIVSFPTRVDREIFYPRVYVPGVIPERGAIRIVTTGRIHSAKGWQLLLEAIEHLNTMGIASTLTFVGDGDERDLLLNRAIDMGLENSVSVTGFLNAFQVSDLLRQSDVFAMASIAEGWSTSLVEAVSISLPIVSTKFSSTDQLVTDNVNGYILKERCSKEFARLIFEASRLDRLKVHTHSQEIAHKYDKNELGNDLLEILES